MKTIAIIFIFTSLCIFSCEKSSQEENEKSIAAVADSEVSTPESFPFVYGVAYDVEDYDAWVDAYNEAKGETIILLRNVDNPAIIVVYEQTNSIKEAEERSKILTSDAFIEKSHTLGNAVDSYYDVKLFQPPEVDYKIYVALIFESENPNDWINKVKANPQLVTRHGLIPAGIGINTFNKEQVYLLAALENYLEFKKNTNTSKEIGKLYEALGVPDNTMISFWGKANL